ncbi:ribosomal protein S5 domain 2-like protein [Coprinopsis marcescibilis]|uniref:Ribosomal protein S5 domain 2-like protein n=1 Tax=Coprinopsis marcescibilis TaxID=230819 RepID=A0A5C3KSE6_COPMA|nr:ribosomal protein S5 domain 2-like protein [Coprinopsis marcescibilis]
MSRVQKTLDSFLSSKKQPAEPVFTSQEIRDRGSIFVANIYHAASPQEALARVDYMKRVVHSEKPASHEMLAWRCMSLKPQKSGLNGPEDFELQAGSKDDGERWAGAKILAVMERLSILDAVVIVSRWFGGTPLGPARFSHIETCTQEVCRLFKDQAELAELQTLLESLDDILADLRQQYKEVSGSSTTTDETPKPKPIYASLDITHAKRLISVRERSITSVKSLIAKKHKPSPPS